MSKALLLPTLKQLTESHLDITRPGMPVEVKVDVSAAGVPTLWVNVGPVCVLRICQLELGENGLTLEVNGQSSHPFNTGR